jgi:hypothetical protein
MNVHGEVRFQSPIDRVYGHLARGVFAHAVDSALAQDAAPVTLLTRYETKLRRWTIVTTEQATLTPGKSITWRHVDGPLEGSVETFGLEEIASGGTLATYTGAVRARNRWFRGLGDRFFVAPVTRRVSMAALEQARREVDGA